MATMVTTKTTIDDDEDHPHETDAAELGGATYFRSTARSW